MKDDMKDDLTTWLDETVYPRLSHELVFDLPGFRRVGRGWVAECPNPDHADRHPSFAMRDSHPFGYCFGCGKTISWWKYQEMKGLSGQQVIQELARLAGVLPLSAGSPEMAAKAHAAAEALENWWQVARAALWRPEGADVLAYLHNRGYTDDQIRQMDVTARPNDPPPGDLKLPPPEYRLLVPARASSSKIIGFAGRRLDGGEPKYQYGPGFQRNSHLWGVYRLRSNDIPVVVEGVLDAETVGIREVVALGGTTLSSAQSRILAQHQRVILALDADDPGRKATETAVRKLTAAGTRVYVVFDFRGAKDPDEYVRVNGLKAFAELCRHAVAGYKWLADRLLPAVPPTNDIERDSVLNTILVLTLDLCTGPVAAKEILDMTASRLGLDPVALAQAVERLAEKRRLREAENLVMIALREAVAMDDWRDAARKVAEAREQADALVQDAPEPIDPVALEYEIAHAADGLLFPWPALSGLCRVDSGGLISVYAASGFGKTNVLYNLLLFYLEKYPGSIIFYSGEMAPRRVYLRLVSILSGVDYGEVERGIRTGEKKTEMIAAQEKLRAYAERLYVLEPLQAPDVTALETAVAAISKRQQITMVIVDYLQQFAPPGKGKIDGSIRYGTREQEVTAVARELHGLGQSRNIPVIAAVQINRAGGMQRKPVQDDARESGAIEQYSQLILGLWNAGRAGVHALRDGCVPAAPPDGWYWRDDDLATRQAAAMAESHGAVMMECTVLKARYHGHENMAVPLMFYGSTGRVEPLRIICGELYVPVSPGAEGGETGKGGKKPKKSAHAVTVLAGGR